MAKATDDHTPRCDQIVMAGRELKRLEVRHRELDAMPTAIGMEDAYRQDEMADLVDRIAILRDFVSTCEAKSLAGCLVQLEQMFSIADFQFGSDCADAVVGRDSRKFRRLHFSVDAFIRKMLPEGLAEAIGEPSPHLNPWIEYQAQITVALRRAA